MPVTKRTLLNCVRSYLETLGRRDVCAGLDGAGNVYVMLPSDSSKRAGLEYDGFNARLRRIAKENGYYVREVTDNTLHMLVRTEETQWY